MNRDALPRDSSLIRPPKSPRTAVPPCPTSRPCAGLVRVAGARDRWRHGSLLTDSFRKTRNQEDGDERTFPAAGGHARVSREAEEDADRRRVARRSVGRQLDVVNPADGTVLAHVPEADEHDVRRPSPRAHSTRGRGAPRNHRSRTPAARARRPVEANARELAEIESDNGKPVMVAQADVAMAAQCFRYMAGWATKIEGSVIDAGMPCRTARSSPIRARFRRRGRRDHSVEFPLLMAAWKLAPALATGCTVVLKPAEDTPLSALRLGELIQAAGFPDGVVNIVTGYGHGRPRCRATRASTRSRSRSRRRRARRSATRRSTT